MDIQLFKINNTTPTHLPKSSSKLIFVVADKNFEDDHEAMLKNIAKALNLNYDVDVELLKLKTEEKIKTGLLLKNSKSLVSFGLHPSSLCLNLDLKPYRILYLESSQIVFVEQISKIKDDKEKKMKLWAILQKMFPQN